MKAQNNNLANEVAATKKTLEDLETPKVSKIKANSSPTLVEDTFESILAAISEATFWKGSIASETSVQIIGIAFIVQSSMSSTFHFLF